MSGWDRELAARQIADRACTRRAAQPARHDGPFLTERRRARLAARAAKSIARQNELRRLHVERCARERAYARARREAAA